MSRMPNIWLRLKKAIDFLGNIMFNKTFWRSQCSLTKIFQYIFFRMANAWASSRDNYSDDHRYALLAGIVRYKFYDKITSDNWKPDICLTIYNIWKK